MSQNRSNGLYGEGTHPASQQVQVLTIHLETVGLCAASTSCYAQLLPGILCQGYYAYLEASGPNPGDKAWLVSPKFQSSGSDCSCQLAFAYNMYGASMGDLNVYIQDSASQWALTSLWSKSGNQGALWHQASGICVNSTGQYQVNLLSGMPLCCSFDYVCVWPMKCRLYLRLCVVVASAVTLPLMTSNLRIVNALVGRCNFMINQLTVTFSHIVIVPPGPPPGKCDSYFLRFCLSVSVHVCPSVRLSVCPSVCLSVCLSVCPRFLCLVPLRTLCLSM